MNCLDPTLPLYGKIDSYHLSFSEHVLAFFLICSPVVAATWTHLYFQVISWVVDVLV